MNIARTSAIVFSNRFASLIISFLGTIIFARELGAAALGIFFLFQAALSSLQLFTNIGTRISVEKRISEGKQAADYLTTAILLKSGIIILASIPIFLLSGYIDGYIGLGVTEWLILALILNEFGSLTTNVLKGELRVAEAALINLLNTITWIGVGILLVYNDFGTFGLIYAIIIGYLAKLLVGVFAMDTGLGSPSVELAVSLFDYAKYSAIPEIDNYFHSWMDILIIGFILTQAAVGAYEVAWRVAGPVMLVASAIGTTIFPQISSFHSDGKTDQIGTLVSKSIIPSIIIVVPAFFGALLLSTEILELLFGAEFTMAAVALIILIAGKGPRAIRKITGLSLMGMDRPDLVTRAAIFEIVTNIVLNVILIYYYGLIGAAIGTTLSMMIGTAQRVYYLNELIEISVSAKQIRWVILSSACMFVVLYPIKESFGVNTIPVLIAFVFTGVLLYASFIFLNQPLRRGIIEQVRDVTNN